MLLLTRKANQCIMIGNDIRIKIIRLTDSLVEIGIEAPRTIAVHREEVFDEILKEKIENGQEL